MLTNLHVKNLALIDEAEVEFGPGLNILTGCLCGGFVHVPDFIAGV